MSDSLWIHTADALLERTASDAPTPGGGSVSMISASFGLGLVVMALEITAKRKDRTDDPSDLIRSARALMGELKNHADADVAAFEAYMAALKLPKSTDEEKASRKLALAEAAIEATKAPLQAARDVQEALGLAQQAEEMAHANIVSDVRAGAYMLAAAGRAVLLNVDANLGSIKDEDAAKRFAEERTHLEDTFRLYFSKFSGAAAAPETGS